MRQRGRTVRHLDDDAVVESGHDHDVGRADDVVDAFSESARADACADGDDLAIADAVAGPNPYAVGRRFNDLAAMMRPNTMIEPSTPTPTSDGCCVGAWHLSRRDVLGGHGTARLVVVPGDERRIGVDERADLGARRHREAVVE